MNSTIKSFKCFETKIKYSELVWNCLIDHEMTKNYPTRERAINAAILKVLEKL